MSHLPPGRTVEAPCKALPGKVAPWPKPLLPEAPLRGSGGGGGLRGAYLALVTCLLLALDLQPCACLPAVRNRLRLNSRSYPVKLEPRGTATSTHISLLKLSLDPLRHAVQLAQEFRPLRRWPASRPRFLSGALRAREGAARPAPPCHRGSGRSSSLGSTGEAVGTTRRDQNIALSRSRFSSPSRRGNQAVTNCRLRWLASREPSHGPICAPWSSALPDHPRLFRPAHRNGKPFLGEVTSCDVQDCAAVLELVGPSLSHWQKARPSPFFPLPLVRGLVKQLLLAVDYLHNGISQGAIGHASITLDNLLLRDCYSKDELTQDKPAISPFLKLGGFNFSVSVQSTQDHWYTKTGGRAAASAEQLLLSHAQYNESPVKPIDVWAVGRITSLLLFARNLAFEGASLADEGNSSPRGPKVRGLPARKFIALASLDPDAGWPSFFSDAHGQMHAHAFNYPFNLPSVKPVATLQERIEAEGKVTQPEERKQLGSFLRACWTLDP